ncbi:MAG TPA: VWA domain-containing protein, partial [Burkholderiaceae bacterium]
MKKSLLAVLAFLLAPAINAAPAPAKATATAAPGAAPVMLVLDASNSMWGRIQNETKFDIARKAVKEYFSALPAGQRVGLTVYGHRSKTECSDVETVVPTGAVDSAKLESVLKPLAPKGKTPLAQSIVHAAEALDYKKQPATVVVVTDGLETCNPDPCATIEKLAKEAKKLTVHVIGFDMRAAEREQLRCIAKAGNGRFVLAGTASELALALTSVKEAPPAPETERSTAKLSTVPEKPKAGAKFDVLWTGTSEEGDTITLSLPEVPHGGGTGYTYNKKNAKAIATAPETAGQYELRYLDKKSKRLGTLLVTVEAAAASIEAPPTVIGNAKFEARWTGPANPNDQIRLIDPEARPGSSIAYWNAAAGTPAKLRAPARSGEFEVIYGTVNGTVLARQRITVAMEPITLRMAGPVKAGQPFQ